MKKGKIIFYVFKTLYNNGNVEFYLRSNQSFITVSIISDSISETCLNKKLNLDTEEGISLLENRLKDAARQHFFEAKLSENEEREYKFMFNMEYSFSGEVRRLRNCNYQTFSSDFIVPMKENEILAFGRVLSRPEIFYHR